MTEIMQPDTNRPAVQMTSAEMRPAPENVQRICSKFTRVIYATNLGDYRLSAVSIKRPNGLTNTHVRLQAPGGQKLSVSLGATDDVTITAACFALLKKSGMTQMPDLNTKLGAIKRRQPDDD